MLWQRILSAFIGIPFALFILYIGGLPFLVSIILLAIIGQREMIKILGKVKTEVNGQLIILSGIIFSLSAYYLSPEFLPSIFLLIVTILFVRFIISFPKMGFYELGVNLLVIIYPGFLFSILILLRNLSINGFIYILLAFLLTWSSDTFAYFTGRTFGKKKLAPNLSPGKTIEGAAGGVLGAILIAVVFNHYYLFWPISWAIFLGGVGSIFAQLGDLFESGIKRLGNVKDSGNLIPGHGGVLDRFDSILFLGPALYMVILLIAL